MIPAFIKKSQIPHKPGVYQFKDNSGKIIYVGKAIDLYHRVASYFSGYNPKSRGSNVINPRDWIASNPGKTVALAKKIASVDTIIVESELEALILEANLIKQYLPEFNVSLKDDKDYLYILITKEVFPKVITARKHDLDGSFRFFGPFPSSRTVRNTLKALRRVFPWCSQPPRPGLAKLRPCFYYHLGLCLGACVGKIDELDYRKNINRLIKLLEGKKVSLVDELVADMEKVSKEQEFEEAGSIKKIIIGIGYLTQSNRTQAYLENPNFLEEENKLALKSLQRVLNLPIIPGRIECYDISNIQGKESTGSMVVMTNGEIDKSQYRKFKIKMTGKPNDVGMHKEMMRRRLKHSEWSFPDLIIVDGGIAQARVVRLQVTGYRLQIPIYGLAKRMEWLYSPSGEVIRLPKSHPASKLLQRIRDEAHRFAITYHRKLHQKAAFGMIKL